MKISDLKQPYRRMAEYLVDINPNELFDNKHLLRHGFTWSNTDGDFWDEVDNGKHPNITPKIKTHFPSDFDFSGEEEDAMNKFELHTRDKFKEVEIPFNFNIFNSMLKNEVKNTFYLDAKKHYTQLAKEGKFDELPETCEFSEHITLDVFDNGTKLGEKEILGKFKGRYISSGFITYLRVKLPTPKIDFSVYKPGDTVIVELTNNEKRIGWFFDVNFKQLVITTLVREGNHITEGGNDAGCKYFNLEKIKSITKIK